jgi:hypothetical protein
MRAAPRGTLKAREAAGDRAMPERGDGKRRIRKSGAVGTRREKREFPATRSFRLPAPAWRS